jgi:P27 family predicted phage terminase small subunit
MSDAELERRRAAQLRPRIVDLAPPKDLSRFERECWVHHSKELARVGLLTELDVGAYRMLCISYAMAMEALEKLRPTDKRRKGLDVIVPDRKYGGTKQNPAVGVFLRSAKAYQGWCVEFGLTPSARLSMRSAFEPDGDDDTDWIFNG